MTTDLALHSSNKTGWPWSLEDSIDTNDPSIDLEYPKITVLTPNYNYGHYLEETIRSVLLQGYPNLEYIIIDGGSTDNSTEIIKKYEPWLTYWVSEPDRGQTHAINKGLEKATGEIFNWINSDDILMPGALFAIAQGMQDSDAFVGVVNNFDESGREVKVFPQNITSTGLFCGNTFTSLPDSSKLFTTPTNASLSCIPWAIANKAPGIKISSELIQLKISPVAFSNPLFIA